MRASSEAISRRYSCSLPRISDTNCGRPFSRLRRRVYRPDGSSAPGSRSFSATNCSTPSGSFRVSVALFSMRLPTKLRRTCPSTNREYWPCTLPISTDGADFSACAQVASSMFQPASALTIASRTASPMAARSVRAFSPTFRVISATGWPMAAAAFSYRSARSRTFFRLCWAPLRRPVKVACSSWCALRSRDRRSMSAFSPASWMARWSPEERAEAISYWEDSDTSSSLRTESSPVNACSMNFCLRATICHMVES